MRLKTFGGLWIENPEPVSDAVVRPRPLALLAILASAGDKGVTRDRVLGVLWPEADEERARQSLSQAIYSLRRELGLEVASGSLLRLDPRQMPSDIADFRAAIATKDWSTAALLYSGPFLDGFYLSFAPEFERWAESERRALANDGIRSIELVARASAERGQREDAAEHWRRLTQLDPANSRIAASYMEALEVAGQHAAAIAHGKSHIQLLQQEFEAKPDRAFEQLMVRLKEPRGASYSPLPSTSIAPPVSSASVPEQPPISTAVASRPKRSWPSTAFFALAVLAAAAIVFAVWSSANRPSTTSPVLAVGRIRDFAAADSSAPAGVLSEMLSTSLGRLSSPQVIAHSRMLELSPRGSDSSSAALTDAARRAGATEVLEGELVQQPDHALRLEVRRIDVARGFVRGGYRVIGPDRISLFDSVTALIAADFRVDAPVGSFAELTTRSPVAYRFYEEGLRALYQVDAVAANRLFQSAVREDSTFAMAAYYAWRSARALEDPNEARLADRAVALAPRATPRDRLLILTHVGAERADLRALAAAETLATRYPHDPEALVLAAQVVGDLPRAVGLLNRAVSLDSAAKNESNALCRLCDALSQLATRYEWSDSSEAVLRTLRRWEALRPTDAAAWGLQADWLLSVGATTDADAAMRRFVSLGGTGPQGPLAELIRGLRTDDADAVNRACAVGLSSQDDAAFAQYRWYCVIGMRNQGRYNEAVALAREGRLPNGAGRRATPRDPYQLALLDMETGHGAAAADEFASIVTPRPDSAITGRVSKDSGAIPDGLRARYRAWLLTLSATAAVAAGDTGRARRLVDTIEVVGHRSLFGRDPLLHHFVRGLLFSRAGQQEAAVREYRAAIHSPTYGYTRINYELGYSLLALGRPAEAIPVVRAALHGGIEGSGLYITRSELHELLARLFDAASQHDSAAVHYAVVERAWRSADPPFKARYETARARAAK